MLCLQIIQNHYIVIVRLDIAVNLHKKIVFLPFRMFPDDDQVFPFEKIEEQKTPAKTGQDDDRRGIMEVKSNPSCSWFKEDLAKTGKRPNT